MIRVGKSLFLAIIFIIIMMANVLCALERPTLIVVFEGVMPQAFVDLFLSERGLEAAGEFPALTQATKKTRVAVVPSAPRSAEEMKKDLLASQFVESVEIPTPRDAKTP